MAKLVSVLGATGTQGGSVVAALLASPDFAVRGITRNTSSPAAQALAAQGVEMVAADLDNEASLLRAFEGSHAIFAVTDFFTTFATQDAATSCAAEARQGINCARAAAATPTLEHYIWSTLPDSLALSDGACAVPHFEGKVAADRFIRADAKLCAKTTFLWVTFYGSNLAMPMLRPTFFKTAGQHLQLLPVSPTCPITTIGSTATNLGLFALAILRQPNLTLPGKLVLAATETRTAADVLALWSAASRKPAVFAQISLDAYDALWPKYGREVGLMLQFWDMVGDRGWTAGEEKVLTGGDLGIEGLVGMEEVLGGMDWEEGA